MEVRKYGWKKQTVDTRDLKYVPHLGLALPEKVDLRPHCPPVYNQGSLGSCTANAIGGLVEFTALKLKHFPFTPSRLFIYYNERALESTMPDAEGKIVNTINEDSGAQIRDRMKVVNTLGAAKEETCPYNVEQFAVKPSDVAYKNGLQHLVTKYEAVEQDPRHIQTCLAAGNPIAFGFAVFSSFETQEVANTGIMPLPHLTEECLGGHAVLMVGYDIAAQHYIVRNSWGANWGAGGYFYMPFEYAHSQLCSDFWTATFVTNHA